MNKRYRIQVSRWVYQKADSPIQAINRAKKKGTITDGEVATEVEEL